MTAQSSYFRIAFLVLFSLAACALSRASSIKFDKQSGPAFTYDLVSTDVIFLKGATITFTGLSGVYGATNLLKAQFAASYTATSATFTNIVDPGSEFFPATFANLFTIYSTAAPGTVSYTATPLGGPISGSLVGPSADVTPEPSSLALLGTGILGVIGFARKRFA